MKTLIQKLALLALLFSLSPLAAAAKKRGAGTVADPIIISDSDGNDDKAEEITQPALKKRRTPKPPAAPAVVAAPAAEEDECPSCLELMNNPDELRTLPCLHKIHIICAIAYEQGRTEVKPPCPLCKAPFTRTAQTEAAIAYPAPYAEPAGPRRVTTLQIPMPESAGEQTRAEIAAAIKHNRIDEPILGLGGQTPLSYACDAMHIELVVFLLDIAHATPTTRDFSGETPLQLMGRQPDNATTWAIKKKLRQAIAAQPAVAAPKPTAVEKPDACNMQ